MLFLCGFVATFIQICLENFQLINHRPVCKGLKDLKCNFGVDCTWFTIGVDNLVLG